MLCTTGNSTKKLVSLIGKHKETYKIFYMTNSDNKYGTFNKVTHVLTQIDHGLKGPQNFTDVNAAKSWFYTDSALVVFDDCCTELVWTVLDNQKLKYTMAFGTKGTPDIRHEDDWGAQFLSRKTSLRDSNNWAKNPYHTEKVDSHLF